VRETGNPIAPVARHLGIADVAAALQRYQTAGGLAFPQEVHVLVADG
jgi:hypothetical protein